MPSSLFSNTTPASPIPVQQLDPRIMQMYQLLKTSNNPSAMMQQLINNNPQMSQLIQLVNQFGGDPKTAFYNEAKRRGVDPNTILSMFN